MTQPIPNYDEVYLRPSESSTRWERCSECHGDGGFEDGDGILKECPACNGDGYIDLLDKYESHERERD